MVRRWELPQTRVVVSMLERFDRDSSLPGYDELVARRWITSHWTAFEGSICALIQAAQQTPDGATASICIQLAKALGPVYRYLPLFEWSAITEELVRTAIECDERHEIAARRLLLRELSYILKITGQHHEALAVATENLAACRQNCDEQPESYLESLYDVVELHEALGQLPVVRALCEEAVEFHRRRGTKGGQYADSLSSLAALLLNTGEEARGAKLLEAAVGIYKEELRASGEWGGRVARNFASTLQLSDRTDEAAEVYEHIRTTYRNTGRLATDDYFDLLKKISIIFQVQGNLDGAREALEEFLHVRERERGRNDITLAIALSDLGSVYAMMGENDEAVAKYRQSLAVLKDVAGGIDHHSAITLTNLAFLFEEDGNIPEAESTHRQALDLVREVAGHSHLEVADALLNLAFLMRENGRTSEAQPLFREALAIRQGSLGDQSYEVAEAMVALGTTAMSLGEREEAGTLLRHALSVYQNTCGKDSEEYAYCLGELAKIQNKSLE